MNYLGQVRYSYVAISTIVEPIYKKYNFPRILISIFYALVVSNVQLLAIISSGHTYYSYIHTTYTGCKHVHTSLFNWLEFAGSFGQVFYGLFTSESDQHVMEVAIKTIKGTNLFFIIVAVVYCSCMYIQIHS